MLRVFANSALSYLRERGVLLLWSVWMVLAVEYMSRSSLGEALGWSITHLGFFTVNLLLVGALLLLLTALTASPRLSYWLLSAILLGLAAVSGIKLRLKGLPLLPWDFALAGEALDVVPWRDIISIGLIGGLAVFLGVSVWVLWWVKPQLRPLQWKERLGWMLTALATAGVIFFAGGMGTWDQAQHVRSSGFALTMTQNLRALSGSIGGVDGAAVAAVMAQVKAEPPDPSDQGEQSVQPNVIVVLSESLFDPTRLPGVTFSRDPLPTLRALSQRYPSGQMLTPEFAGSTANVELEVLTGLSMRLLPDGVLAYERYIDRPVDSLASILARQGYQTTVISPWGSQFFNSTDVYRSFGFRRFISQEFMPPVWAAYGLIADAEVGKLIIGETEKTPGPDFIFANTAENHYPYGTDKFEQNTITVTGLTGEGKAILESYAQGCDSADKMLKMLVDHYSVTDEPTVIAFFGDHLPLLGSNYQVYKDSGYITGESDPAFMEKIYRTPVLVWNNFKTAQPERLDFGTNMLGPYVLREAGLPGTPFTDFLWQLKEKVPAIPARRYWSETNLTEADLKDYAALQKDILFGAQHAYDGYQYQIVDSSFTLGFGRLTLDRATVQDDGLVDDLTVVVEGQHLPAGGVVYAGGKPLATTWESHQRMLAKLPRSAYAAGSTLEVDVRALNFKKDAVVASTNPVPLSVAR